MNGTKEDHMDIKVDWATQQQNFLQLDIQSFDELLKIVTLTIMKRNTNLQAAVTSSQCLSIWPLEVLFEDMTIIIAVSP